MSTWTVDELPDIDPNIWKTCAGSLVQIPRVNSLVYYFPQGHSEQASTPPDFSSATFIKPYVLCRIISVRFLADPNNDKVFSKICLEPLDEYRAASIRSQVTLEKEDDDNGEEDIVSCAKILTQSDANNGGGFSVLKFCAESIFPVLDFSAKPPVQKLFVRDVHGVVWDFRHIYRGTPLRHLLTTGWSKFVNRKNLVAGDCVVFMKNGNDDLFVGIRRTVRSSVTADCGRWNCQMVQGEESEEVFWRSNARRVSADSVMEAAKLSGVGKPFDIVYYPRAGSPDFIVKADTVDASLNMYWTTGMRVKMAVETEELSKITWFQGTVSAVSFPEHGVWRGSPWRALQVNWDEPEVLQNLKSVNPWQVELVAATSPFPTTIHPTKKFKVPQNFELLTDGQGDMFFPMTVTNSMTGHLNSSLFSRNISPAGMQGARHDPICVPNLANSLANNIHHMYSEHLYGNNMPPRLGSGPIELNIGGTSQSDNMSLLSQASVHSFSTEVLGKQSCNSTTKAGNVSFQLFGKIIDTCKPVVAGLDNNGCSEDDGGIGYKVTEEVIKNFDLNLSYPFPELYGRLDIQCPRVSAVETCSL